jgi:hypothetical protein
MRVSHLALAGAALATALATLGSTPARAATSPATHALQYLVSQQGSNGAFAGVGSTEDTIIGTADNGYDPATLVAPSGTSALSYLAAQTSAGNTDKTAGSTAKLILALVAAHLSPTSFAGKNLVSQLLSPAQLDSASGKFDPASPEPFSQALGILALNAASPPVPAAAVSALLTAAVRALLAMQSSADQGWGFPGSPSDSNSTALALEALAAVGLVPAQSPSGPAQSLCGALGFLHGLQNSDAGFGFAAGSPSDPDSDAYVLQALAAVGQDPAAAVCTKGGATPLSNLLTFQDATTGGFRFAAGTSADTFTTSQIPAALAGKPYGAITTFAAGLKVPAVAVATPVATATPPATPPPGGVSHAPTTGGGPVVVNTDEKSTGWLDGGSAAAMGLLAAGSAGLLAAGGWALRVDRRRGRG